MSSYVRTTDFTAKDALLTGNPLKVAKGTEIQAELDNIATAITSKIDSTSKGAASGVAGLDGSAKVPTSQLPSTIVYSSAVPVLTTNLEISKNAPQFIINDSAQASGSRAYGISMSGSALLITCLSDDFSTGSVALSLTRTGTTPTTLTLTATTVNIVGVLKVNGTTVTVP